MALVDKITGQVILCGPESYAKMEILVPDASGHYKVHYNNHTTTTSTKFNTSTKFTTVSILLLLVQSLIREIEDGPLLEWMEFEQAKMSTKKTGTDRVFGFNLKDPIPTHFFISGIGLPKPENILKYPTLVG
ncbi:hypothetical protein DH2020_027337 [Rehmannia glutinosa]|uniref:Uncharacterized protein n=1 Tax=Rehmannia glutinosa TaxID=99300 RepID=A0ABR0VVE6_REHGL